MSTAEAEELAHVLDRVKTWSPPLRITLARRILETLERPGVVEVPPRRIPMEEVFGLLKTDAPPPTEEPTRGWPVEKVLGLLKTDREPPDDEECRRIIEEERWKKYGS